MMRGDQQSQVAQSFSTRIMAPNTPSCSTSEQAGEAGEVGAAGRQENSPVLTWPKTEPSSSGAREGKASQR